MNTFQKLARLIDDGYSAEDAIRKLASTFEADEIVVGSPTGGAQGEGTINATAVYKNGVQLGVGVSYNITDNSDAIFLTVDSSENAVFTGTVNGRDISTDGTKLDTLSTSSYYG